MLNKSKHDNKISWHKIFFLPLRMIIFIAYLILQMTKIGTLISLVTRKTKIKLRFLWNKSDSKLLDVTWLKKKLLQKWAKFKKHTCKEKTVCQTKVFLDNAISLCSLGNFDHPEKPLAEFQQNPNIWNWFHTFFLLRIHNKNVKYDIF